MQVESKQLDDIRWLVSEKAESFLKHALTEVGSTTSLLKALRRDVGTARASLVLEQIDLRRRARVKFRHADRMFFTAERLEQATDEAIAAYKAQRLAVDEPVADLCCGIGGDLQALAHRTAAVGIDRDPVSILMARANAELMATRPLSMCVADVATASLSAVEAWHIDPDRRAGGRRSTRWELLTPPEPVLKACLRQNPHAAIKLAPATEVDSSCFDGELRREWIGSRGECRQQVVWSGRFAESTEHVATVVDRNGDTVSMAGRPVEIERTQALPAEFLYEPHATVLAAGLQGKLAADFGLTPLTGTSAYLTSDQQKTVTLAAPFQVVERLPFDEKRIRALLRQRGWAAAEVKQRRSGIDVNALQRRWKKLEGEPMCIFILGGGTRTWAAVTQRL